MLLTSRMHGINLISLFAMPNPMEVLPSSGKMLSKINGMKNIVAQMKKIIFTTNSTKKSLKKALESEPKSLIDYL